MVILKKNGRLALSQPTIMSDLSKIKSLLTKADSLLRANACACATLCAEVRVD